MGAYYPILIHRKYINACGQGFGIKTNNSSVFSSGAKVHYLGTVQSHNAKRGVFGSIGQYHLQLVGKRVRTYHGIRFYGAGVQG